MLLTVLLAACGSAQSADFVTRNGAQLRLAGQPYQFKGLDIYNANSRDNCSYNLQTGAGLDSSLNDIGPRSQNAFRAWFYQRLATVEGRRDWAAFDRTLAIAAAHKQHVIATLGDQWGDCEVAPGLQGAYKGRAWYESGYRQDRLPGLPQSYRDWVRDVVSRYKDNPTILAWQLMNEAEDADSLRGTCAPAAAASLRGWAADMGQLVKSVDQRHLLSIGTIGGGQCGASGPEYQQLHELPDVDLCEYHDHGQPLAAVPGDAFNGLQARVDQCQAIDKPLFVGEMGIDRSGAGSLQQRAALFDAKLAAQSKLKVAGWLLWDWVDASHSGSSDDALAIEPGDPILEVLTHY